MDQAGIWVPIPHGKCGNVPIRGSTHVLGSWSDPWIPGQILGSRVGSIWSSLDHGMLDPSMITNHGFDDLMVVGVHDLKYHMVAPYIPSTDPSRWMVSRRDVIWSTDRRGM